MTVLNLHFCKAHLYLANQEPNAGLRTKFSASFGYNVTRKGHLLKMFKEIKQLSYKQSNNQSME